MRLIAVFATIAASACIPATVTQMSLSPMDASAASQALGAGTGTITGSALIRQSGGGVVTCAGNDVFLVPATESATREVRRVFGSEEGFVRRGGHTSFGGGTLVSPPEPNRRTTCNAQGFFTFGEVRAGKWHVMTAITWVVGSEYQGGTLLTTAVVPEGGTVEIVMSQ